jgi:hypothetical protein
MAETSIKREIGAAGFFVHDGGAEGGVTVNDIFGLRDGRVVIIGEANGPYKAATIERER